MKFEIIHLIHQQFDGKFISIFFLIPGYGHYYGDGKSFSHRHQAIDHFRREYVYHWNYVSVPKQVYSCPHCQYPFDSWSKMDQHVMSEHNSYGLYYSEPDYIGKIDFILVFLINLNYLSATATYLAENLC